VQATKELQLYYEVPEQAITIYIFAFPDMWMTPSQELTAELCYTVVTE